MINLNIKKKAERYLAFLLMLILTLIALPLDANAATQAYLTVTIDTSSNSYRGTVFVSDEWSAFNNPEKDTLHLGDRPLTFPNSEDNMTKVDSLGAEFTNNILVTSLNAALYKINDGEQIKDLDTLKSLTNTLNSGGDKNGYTVTKGSKDGKPYLDLNYDIDGDGNKDTLEDSNFITITSPNGEKNSYPYQMKKYTSNNNDERTIDWEDLTEQAWAYHALKVTSTNIGNTIIEPNLITKTITNALNFVVSGLQTILGLSSITDLVFNEGLRDTGVYIYGIFPAAWQTRISIVFIISQSISCITILLSIINLVFRKNLSTMTTSLKVDTMLNIQRLILVALILALLFPAFNIILKFSYLLTDVFSNMMQPEAKAGFFSTMPAHGNGIAAILVYIAYFVVSVVINVQYIIRSVIVPLLIAISPILIVFLTLGESYKKISIEWLRILLSNIFIQPINALVLGFLMSIPYNSIQGIDALVYVYAMIPISEIIKSIIFQYSDGTSKATGDVSKSIVGSLLAAKNLAMKSSSKFFESSGDDKQSDEVKNRESTFSRNKSNNQTNYDDRNNTYKRDTERNKSKEYANK